MNREIKFRAWNKEVNKMVYKYEDDSSGYWDGVHGTDIELVNNCLSSEFTDYVWMQYTGSKDKDGKEIYEGDKISFTKERYVHGVLVEETLTEFVEYEDGCYWLGEYEFYECLKDDERIIVGNIYEKP